MMFPKPTRTRKPRKPLRSTGTSKYARRPRDLDYLAWVRTRPCAVRDLLVLNAMLGIPFSTNVCTAPVEAHHAGRRGLGQKADDNTAIPLCRRHHRELHDARGAFAGWTKAERRAWQDEQAALTLDRYLRRAPGGVF